MTQNEVAERIGVTRQTVNNWLRSGKFPDCCIKVMGRRLPGTFDRNKVEAWIKENVK
ncbi:TPA: helix-turn-helix domain-containing protein [Escherichia coli]|nr:helix-turn-helix domain-containing protein [Escherichia coli]